MLIGIIQVSRERERERKAKKSQREIGNSFTTYSSILYFCISIFYIITVTLLDVSYVTLELLHNYGNSENMSSKNVENEECKRYISKLSVSCNCLSLNMKYEELNSSVIGEVNQTIRKPKRIVTGNPTCSQEKAS